MTATPASAHAVTRLPIPHLFMALSIGIFALTVVLSFAPATASDGDPAAAWPQPGTGQVRAVDTETPIAVKARGEGSPAAPTSEGSAFALLGFPLVLRLTAVRAGRMLIFGSDRPTPGLVAGLSKGVATATVLFRTQLPTALASTDEHRSQTGVEQAFLAWLAEPDSADAVTLEGTEEPQPLAQTLDELCRSGRVLPAQTAGSIGLPTGATVGQAAGELRFAVEHPAGPRCRSFRAALYYLRDLDRTLLIDPHDDEVGP
jgi:hypothetical protein